MTRSALGASVIRAGVWPLISPSLSSGSGGSVCSHTSVVAGVEAAVGHVELVRGERAGLPVGGDGGLERAVPGEPGQGRERIGGPAEQALEAGLDRGGDVAGQPDADQVGEVGAVDVAEVDVGDLPAGDQDIAAVCSPRAGGVSAAWRTVLSPHARPSRPAKIESLTLGVYAAREFETSDPDFADVLFDIHYLVARMP